MQGHHFQLYETQICNNSSDEPGHKAVPPREDISVSVTDRWNSEFQNKGIKYYQAWYWDPVSFQFNETEGNIISLSLHYAIPSVVHYNNKEEAILRIKEFHYTTIAMFTVYKGNNLISHANGGYSNYGLTWLDGHRRQLLVTVMFTSFDQLKLVPVVFITGYSQIATRYYFASLGPWGRMQGVLRDIGSFTSCVWWYPMSFHCFLSMFLQTFHAVACDGP
jgi:hypothetical protein